MNFTVTIPTKFYDDHCARDLPAGTVVKRTKRNLEVNLDSKALIDLLDDARHYAGFEGPDFKDNRAVCMAARGLIPHLADLEPIAQANPTPAEPTPAPAGGPRSIKMKAVRIDGTEKRYSWKSNENAHAWAIAGLEAGELTSAAILVGDEWIEVVK